MTGEISDITSWLLNETQRMGASACDAIFFESVDISSSYRLGKPEGVERSESQAVGLRCFIGDQQAIVSSTDTNKDALLELATRAVAMAHATPPDPNSTLAPESLYAKPGLDLDLCDNNEPEVSWLTEQCKNAEEAALSVTGITNSEGASAGYSKSRITLAVHNGKEQCFAGTYYGSHFSTSISVIAGVGTGMERDYDFSTTRHREDLKDASSIGLNASHRALKRLNPRKIPTCRAPVVFDPQISRGLLGVLGSAISGSSITRGASFLKDAMNERIFPEHINIVDDPHIIKGLGSKPFDGEGVTNGKKLIVENGVLTTWLLDVRTANKLGLISTGHASRGVASPPSPSSTNFYIEAGTVSPEALIKEIKSGLYVTETFGMGINTVTGDYSQGAAGFWIENGEIVYPVSEITIAGQLRDMFATVTAADDLIFRYSTNAPTLRIESMTIAGT